LSIYISVQGGKSISGSATKTRLIIQSLCLSTNTSILSLSKPSVRHVDIHPSTINANWYIAWKYYFVFTGIQIFLIVFAWFFFLETRGCTIEEASLLYDGPEAVQRARNRAENDLAAVDSKEETTMREGEPVGAKV
jgi:hypothetical protein